MSDIFSKYALPTESEGKGLVIKETYGRLKVFTTKKSFNKLVTIIEGLKGEDLGRVAKELKHKLACGGSSKDGLVVLQGDHKEKVVELLIGLGYQKDLINH